MMKKSGWERMSETDKKAAIMRYAKNTSLTTEQAERLADNLPIVRAFITEAHKIAAKRTHYSARTIVEFLRHHSILEDNCPDYKINDHLVPLLSRISMEMFPALNALFHTREKANYE